MYRFSILLITIATLVCACRPAPFAPPAETTASSTAAGTSGSGGAAPVDAGAPDVASVTSTATGSPAPACEAPAPKHTACDNPSDCFDRSACTADVCDLATPPNPPDPFGRRGTCRWTVLPDGAPCDVSDGADRCQRGACCPPGVLPPATTPAPAAAVAPPPEVR